MAFSNDKLNIGEHFIYNGIEFICLDIIDGNYLAMTAKPWAEIPFDTNNHNDWRKSSLRRVLNTDFLELLDKKHLVMQTSDLIADNGDKAYGTSEDYVTILSCDQYRKYRDIVPLFEEWMWTLTPWSCYPSDSYYVRTVYEIRKSPSRNNRSPSMGLRLEQFKNSYESEHQERCIFGTTRYLEYI